MVSFQLEVDVDSIRLAICSARKLKVKPNQVVVLNKAMLCVHPIENNKSTMHYVMQQLKNDLPSVLIKVGFDVTSSKTTGNCGTALTI